MNIYRGCNHGCIYCDSRSTCYSINHEFEDIEIKKNAPSILEQQLKGKRKKGMIITGSMSDPYIPLEKELEYTKQCLQVIDKYNFGISILTKSDLILRDLDILKSINNKSKCIVNMTLTTYDEDLCKIIEPNVCTTKRRVEVLNIMKDNNIDTVVWLGPILPFINDSEENLKGLLNYCVEAKVKAIMFFSFGVTMREGNREYFYKEIDKYFPNIKEKYIKTFGNNYICESLNNKKLMKILISVCTKNNIIYKPKEVFEYLSTYKTKYEQLVLQLD